MPFAMITILLAITVGALECFPCRFTSQNLNIALDEDVSFTKYTYGRVWLTFQ